MIKYIIFGKTLFSDSDNDALKIIFNDILSDKDVVYIPPKKSGGEKWIDFWNKKRGFRKWAALFGLPFRKAAYRSILGNCVPLKDASIPVFLFFKNEGWYFGKDGFLRYLRDRYPSGALVYKLLNVVEYIDDNLVA